MIQISTGTNIKQIEIVPHLLIRASAGSGKTYSLALRYISLLLSGVSPAAILATTFTNKAAGEIVERVLDLLILGSCSEQEASKLSNQIGTNADRAVFLSLLQSLVDQQHRIQICTLDSFFSVLGRCFSWDLKVPKNWSLLSPDQTEAFLSQTLAELLQTKSDLIAPALRAVARADASRGVFEKLEKVIEQGLVTLRTTSLEAWGNLKLERTTTTQAFESALKVINQAVAPLTQQKTPNKNWENSLAEIKQSLTVADWLSVISNSIVAKCLEGQDKYDKKTIEPDLAEACLVVATEARFFMRKELADRTKAIAALVFAFEGLYQKRLEKSHCLGFDDLKHRIAEAVANRDLSEVYYRLDSKINHLLLDEFQDTSVFEWLALVRLADEVVMQNAASSFFCVGDTKQAIYGWRGGEAGILRQLPEYYEGRLEEQPLSTSWRSEPLVLSTVDKIFLNIQHDQAILERYPNAIKKWFQGYSEHSAAKNSDGLAYVHFEVFDQENNPDQDEQEQNEPTLYRSACLVRELISQNPDISVGVLCRNNKSVARLLTIFRSPAFNISASEESGVSLVTTPAVALICLALRLATFPSHKIDAFELANSVLGPYLKLSLGDSAQAIAKVSLTLRTQIVEQGLSEFISELCDVLLPQVGAREAAQLRMLQDLAARFGHEYILRPAEFIQRVEGARYEEPSSGLVRVMTIHKSKGLEFDAVVLPELKEDLAKLDRQYLVRRSSWAAPADLVIFNPVKDQVNSDPELSQLESDLSEVQLQESLSLLYVALTRARRAIYAVISKLSKRDWQKRKQIPVGEVIWRVLESDAQDGVYKAGCADWASKLAQQAPLPLDNNTLPLFNFKAKSVQLRPKRLVHVTPSQLEGKGAAQLSDLFKARSVFSFGSHFHKFLESVEWLTEQELLSPSEFLTATAFAGAEQQELLPALSRYNEVLAQVLNKQKFNQRYGTVLKVYRELPFSYAQEAQLVSGIIDRVVLFGDEASPQAVVFDYKTDRIAVGEIEQRAEFYRPQLEAYRLGVQALFGIAPKNTILELCFLEINQLYRL